MKVPAKHILIVDDKVMLRKLLAESIQTEGYVTFEASDGAEALGLLEKIRIDAIASDVVMPGMDGYRLCYEVRRSRKHSTLPFIFLTAAYTSADDEQHALDLGADRILRKPISTPEVLDALSEMFCDPVYQKPRTIKPISEVEINKEYTDSLSLKLEEKITQLHTQSEELEKFSIVLEQIADSVVITNKDGVIEYVNRSFERNTGYLKEFAIGKTPAILKSGKHDAAFYEKLWNTILSGETFQEEFINRKSNGELYYEQQTISPVFDNERKIVHFVCAGKDVTRRRMVDDQLRSAHAQLQELIEHSPAVIFKMKIEAGRVYPYVVSQNISHLLGFTEEEVKNFEWWGTHIHPDDRESMLGSIEETLRRGTLNCEYRLRHKNGEYIWVGDTQRVLRDQAGRSQEIIGVWTDITERKRAEATTLQLAAIVQSSNDAIISKDLYSIITTWNEGAEKIFGYSAGEMIGTSIMRLIPADRQGEENHLLTKIVLGERFEHFETQRQTKDGQLIDVSITESPIRDAAGKVIGASKVARNITEQKRADEQIRKLNRVYAVLSNINQTIVRIHDPQQLFNEACRIAVEAGHFWMAWIGKLNRETQRVDVIASAGTTNGYPSNIDIDLNNEKLSLGPSGRAIATSTHVISNDIENDDAMRPWRDDLRALDIRSSVAFPLEVFGKVWGVFNLYSSEVGFFDADEIKLLDELAMDISFAIEFIQQEADRKGAERALEDSERKFKLLFVTNPHPMWFFDPKTLAFLDVNEAATRQYGYSREEFLSMTIKDIRPPDEIARLLEDIAEAHEGLDFSGQWRHQKKDGTIIQVEVTSHQIDYSGRKAKVVLAHDITARKLAVENLVQSEEKYRRLFEESTDGLFISTVDGKILDANPALVKMMGYDSKEEVLALDVTNDIYANESERERLLKMLESEGFVENFETVEKKKDGQKINVLLNVTAVRDNEGNISMIRGLTRDITKQRQLEQQFLRAQRMESIGTLAGGIAHDLNNVLSPIMMGIGMLKKSVRNEEGQKILHTLEVSTQRGSDLVKQVLAFARGVSGERVLLMIGHLIREMQTIVQQTFPKSIHFRSEVSRTLWQVSADATQMHQVLMNLSVNARDAMPNGGVLTMNAENLMMDATYALMNIHATAGPHVVLTVTDTGVGIPSELLNNVFEPFFTTKEIGKGTGLGLSTVHSIVKSHGGYITVYSEVGKGTTFRVYLPAVTTVEEKKSSVDSNQLPAGHGELILVVDDESSIREICRSILEAYGYKVLLAVDGTDAVVQYTHNMNDIRLVITDMMMPFMDGHATIRALSKIDSQVRIIATSGLSGQEKVIAESDLQIVGFLAKPYTASKLLHVVANGLKQTGKDTSGKLP